MLVSLLGLLIAKLIQLVWKYCLINVIIYYLTDCMSSAQSNCIQLLFFIQTAENGYQHVTANGPAELTVRQRHRAPRSEPSFPQRELDTDESTDSTLRKPARAKSQPPASAAERTSNRDNRRSNIRYDWAERSMEARERRRLNMKGSASAGEVSTKHWVHVI